MDNVFDIKAACGHVRPLRIRSNKIGMLSPSWVRRAEKRNCSKWCGRDSTWHENRHGYFLAKAKYHPCASPSGQVFRSWDVMWRYHNKASWVPAAKSMGWTIHHRDGNRANDLAENLELRPPGNHPQGVNLDDMISMLEYMGYAISFGGDYAPPLRDSYGITNPFPSTAFPFPAGIGEVC